MMRRSTAFSRFLPLGISVAALGVVAVLGAPLGGWLRGTVADIFDGAPQGEFAELSRADLAERFAASERELERIRYQGVLYGLMAAENAELKKAAKPVSGFAAPILARVLARPPQTHYDTLLLNVGRGAGVSENDLVAYEGVALGRIVFVEDDSSLAQLYSSPRFTQDVILGDPSAVAVAEGLGGGAFQVSLPHEVLVSPGDPVRIPRSETMILGIVAESEGKASDASKTVRFRSPVSYHMLDYVSILSQESRELSP